MCAFNTKSRRVAVGVRYLPQPNVHFQLEVPSTQCCSRKFETKRFTDRNDTSLVRVCVWKHGCRGLPAAVRLHRYYPSPRTRWAQRPVTEAANGSMFETVCPKRCCLWNSATPTSKRRTGTLVCVTIHVHVVIKYLEAIAVKGNRDCCLIEDKKSLMLIY